MHGIVTVNSFLEDHMADMRGRGAEHLISAAYHSHRLPTVGCQDPSLRVRTALTSRGSLT
jgi:hypothetical protein